MSGRRVRALLAAALLVAVQLTVLARTASPASAAGFPAQMAYVVGTGANTVTPINVATGVASTAIIVGNAPTDLQITPDGTKAYVVNSGDNTVTPINLATNTAGTRIAVGSSPRRVAFSPDGTKAYVTNRSADTVTPITVSTNTPGTPFAVGDAPGGVVFTPNGLRAYVSNEGSDSVSVVDVATNAVTGTIAVGDNALGMAVTPDGAKVLVANLGSDSVSVIATATNTVVATIPVDDGGGRVAISPDGTKAYVANMLHNTFSVITVATNTRTGTITFPNLEYDPSNAAFAPDGATAYFTLSHSNKAQPVNTTNDSLGTGITVGAGPDGVAMTPAQAPNAALAPITGATTGAAVSLDASGSTGTSAPIASYAWTFGDGQTSTTTIPTTTHAYATAGTYTVTVTVTDTIGTSTTRVFTGQTMSRNGSTAATAGRNVTITDAPPSFRTSPAVPTYATTLTGSDQLLSDTVQWQVANSAAAGWNISLTSTTWTSGSRTLPTTATTVPNAPGIACETTCVLASNGITYPYVVPAATTAPTATKIVNAATGTGTGNQVLTTTFRLAVPARSYAGTYSSTWTVTMSSGP